MEERSLGNCSSDSYDKFMAIIEKQNLMRVNELVVGNAILAGILVGIGAYSPRYRHHAFIRFLFQGATTLFLPIFSYVVSSASSIFSTVGQQDNYSFFIPAKHSIETLWFKCNVQSHLYRILLWAGFVQIVGINTCALVAADNREGRNIGLSVVQFAKAIWTSYLVVYMVVLEPYSGVFLLPVFALVLARLVLKYYAFQMARRSFALGRNPRLIIGHMEQLQEERQHVGPAVEHLFPPPLIVMGEERQLVTKQPHGYCIKHLPNQDGIAMANKNGLVTIDKIWQLDDVLLRSIPRIKDVCFSLALFKLLRCRFAGYTVAEAGIMKTHDFFWHVLLKDSDTERVFRIIEDELSFLHDYYYSSLPISYSKSWLPILSILNSLLTIICCLFVGFLVVVVLVSLIMDTVGIGQITCFFGCSDTPVDFSQTYLGMPKVKIGNFLFDLVPLLLLVVLVVLAETRDITSYICSNWTKVALICHYVVSHDIRQRSPRVQRWVSRVLRCRCNLMKHWDDKMNQCSVLVLHPREPPIVLFMHHLLHLPEQKKNVKIPTLVKAGIVDALRSSNGVAAFLCRSLQDGGNFRWACSGTGTADTILVWHIATSILEVRHPPASDNKVVATHLSRYCAYLVAYMPELLPDDDTWCKSLYKAVKKDSVRVLAGGVAVSTAADEYEQLVALLTERSEHEVLKKGVRLGKQLAELTGGEETAWKMLAGFWSEMILSVAPSDNLNGHAEAIALGGELITLVWALLMHAGVATGPSNVAASAAAVQV